MVIVRPLDIPEVLEIVPEKYGDHRGFFSEVWSRARLAEQGVDLDWVQDNQSFSVARGVLRGLHYQTPPFAQAKLVRVIRGSIWDVAVDIRRGSPTYGRWAALTVSAEKWNQVLVPAGFAHGFVTLEPDCEVLYKVSAVYAPGHDRSIRFDDPALAIDWPVAGEEVILSDKDRDAPTLADSDTGFIHGVTA
ncbi:MAG TPA: dTDP-4-dehydrorhamnose 3,5-epimerase [Allosphingosinicella sp.]|jgi:dTDP-4-dehydrorhamnose 3,5-epimerase